MALPALLAVFSPAPAQVGDFAPLETGNTWTYQISRRGRVLSDWYWANLRRTLRVTGQSKIGDTTRYQIALRDSIFDRKDSSLAGVRHLPDTVALFAKAVNESESGDLFPAFELAAFFTRHAVPESFKDGEVVSQFPDGLTFTEHLRGPVLMGGISHWVYLRKRHKQLGGMGAHQTDSTFHVQNVGMAWARGGTSTPNGFSYDEYQLVEFNGRPVDFHPPATAIRPRPRLDRRHGIPGIGSVILFQESWDGLGRLRP